MVLFWSLTASGPHPLLMNEKKKKTAWKRKGSQQEGEWMVREISCLGELKTIEKELNELSFAQMCFAQIC